MSVLVFHAKHDQDLSEYDDTTGAVEWVPQGLNGSCGAMQVTPGAAEASAYKDITANAEDDFSVQLYLAQRTVVIPALAVRKILQVLRNSGTEEKIALFLYNDGTQYALILECTDDSDVTHTTSAIPLGDTWPAYVELRCKRATNGTGANNGSIVVEYPSGTQDALTNKDLYDEFDFDRVKVGCISTGTENGFFVIDDVRVMTNDTGYFLIGPLGEPAHPPTLKSQGHAEKTLLVGRSGDVWEVDLSNDGLPCVRYPRYAAAGSVRAFDALTRTRCQLFDSEHTGVWRIQVDDSTPHAPQLEAYAVGTTNAPSYEDLPIFSHNAREWAMTVNSSGTIVLTAQTTAWPVLYGAPRIPVDNTHEIAQISVTDAGAISTDIVAPNGSLQALYIRSQDNRKLYQVTFARSGGVGGSLTVTTTDVSSLMAAHLYYDYEMASANGTVWRLQVDGDKVFSAFNVTAFEHSRQGHTVAIDSQGKIVVIDPRFKTAHQRKTGWGGRTFRGGRA